jgi:hypothetical protein
VAFNADVRASDPAALGAGRGRDAAEAPEQAITVRTPRGAQRPADVKPSERGVRVAFAGTHEPGAYAFVFPTNLAPAYASNLVAGTRYPFAVLGDIGESRFTALDEQDMQKLGADLDLFFTSDSAEAAMAVADSVPGRELWTLFALAGLLGVVGELGLSRWISIKRRYHAEVSVDFGGSSADIGEFRRRAEALLGGKGT